MGLLRDSLTRCLQFFALPKRLPRRCYRDLAAVNRISGSKTYVEGSLARYYV